MLSSHGLEETNTKDDDLAVINRLIKRLNSPFQGAQANATVTKAEFRIWQHAMIEYAVLPLPSFINL